MAQRVRGMQVMEAIDKRDMDEITRLFALRPSLATRCQRFGALPRAFAIIGYRV